MAKIYLNKDGVLFTRTKNHDGRFVTLHFSQDIIPFIIRNNIQLYQELPNKWKENSSTLDYIFTLNNGEDKNVRYVAILFITMRMNLEVKFFSILLVQNGKSIHA